MSFDINHERKLGFWSWCWNLWSILSGKNGLWIKSWYCLRQLHRDNAKWIDERDVFIFFDVFVFSGGRAGRLIRAACSRDSKGACKGQVISISGRAKPHRWACHWFGLPVDKPNQASSAGAFCYRENNKGYNSLIGSRVCTPEKTFGYFWLQK